MQRPTGCHSRRLLQGMVGELHGSPAFLQGKQEKGQCKDSFLCGRGMPGRQKELVLGYLSQIGKGNSPFLLRRGENRTKSPFLDLNGCPKESLTPKRCLIELVKTDRRCEAGKCSVPGASVEYKPLRGAGVATLQQKHRAKSPPWPEAPDLPELEGPILV